MVTNSAKQELWQAYRGRHPMRVPVMLGVNPRIVLLDPKLNPRGITFEEYYRDAGATIEIQLAFLDYQVNVLNQYTDSPTGWPETFAFYADNQNFYDSAYFGAPLAFHAGQVGDVEPYLAGAGRQRLFEIDINRPMDNPFIRQLLARHEALVQAARDISFHGVRLTVNPPLLGFDGPLTVAANLRSTEIYSDLYEDWPYAEKALDFIQRGASLRNRALAEAFGVKDYAGPGWFADDSIALLSPRTYIEKVLPYHRLWYDQWPWPDGRNIHLCGDATRHFPAIARELGVQSFDTGFPVDFGPLRQQLGPDVEIFGGVEVHTLLSSTPAGVYERAKAILTSGVMDGGRFVLREANNLPPRVPVENLAAMYRACLDHGNYEERRP